MDVGVGGVDGRPRRRGRVQATGEQALQADEFCARRGGLGGATGSSPFSAPAPTTRAREAWMAARRSRSRSPGALKGGRSSSVSALRTA